MQAQGQFITLQEGAEAKAVVAPELGGWLLSYARHFPGRGYVDVIHFNQEVVDRYPNQMYAGNPILFPLVSFNIVKGEAPSVSQNPANAIKPVEGSSASGSLSPGERAGVRAKTSPLPEIEHFYDWRLNPADAAPTRFPMAQHGFARKSKWKVSAFNETMVRMELRDDEKTRAIYPFAFLHELQYELKKGRLHFTQRIVNHSKKMMPFSVGIHPYLQVPLTPPSERKNCSLVFPAAKKMIAHGKMESFTAESFPAQKLSIDQDFSGTMFLADLAKREIQLEDSGSGLVTTLNWEDSPEYRFVALWSKSTEEPFFCIEPWTALPNSFGRPDGELILLEPAQEFRAALWMDIAPIS